MLVILEGHEKNRQYPLRKAETVIGRESSADFVIEDTKVSRHHSKVIFSNREEDEEIPDCRIVDLDSTNGTFLNGHEVLDEDGVWLQDRDRIVIGNTTIGYFLVDEDALSLV